MNQPSEPYDHSWSIAREYEWQVSRMGPPPKEPRPRSAAQETFITVRQGDGSYAEAVAAVMWHCGLSADEAEEAVRDIVRGFHTG